MTEAGDRTIPATPRRREAARDQGLAPTAAVLAWPLLAGLVLTAGPWWGRAVATAAVTAVQAASPGGDEGQLLGAVLAMAGPTVVLALAALAVLIGVRLLGDQAGWRLGRAGFRFDRIDPVAGIGRLFAAANWIRSLLALLSLLGLLAVCRIASGPLVATMRNPQPGPVGAAPSPEPLAAAEGLLWQLLAAAAVVAVAQWAVQRLLFERRIRMTPQEFRDELRSLQADPKVRWRR